MMKSWYTSFNSELEPGYLSGQKHGQVIETNYMDKEHPNMIQLLKVCRNECTSTWSVGYFPNKYKGITFRFFNDKDIELFKFTKAILEDKINGFN